MENMTQMWHKHDTNSFRRLTNLYIKSAIKKGRWENLVESQMKGVFEHQNNRIDP